METELSIHKQLCDALAKDRQAFYTFAQELAIDVLSQLLAGNMQNQRDQEDSK